MVITRDDNIGLIVNMFVWFYSLFTNVSFSIDAVRSQYITIVYVFIIIFLILSAMNLAN